MAVREQDDLPYRSAGAIGSSPSVVTKNEENYDTLKIVSSIISERLENLYKDFNAFEVLSIKAGGPRTMALEELLLQIESKKIAYDILTEAYQAVETAIQGANKNYNQRKMNL